MHHAQALSCAQPYEMIFGVQSAQMRTGRGPGPPKGQTNAAETSAQERVQAGVTELLAVLKTLKVRPMHNPRRALSYQQVPCSIEHR